MFGKPQVNNDYIAINSVIVFNLCLEARKHDKSAPSKEKTLDSGRQQEPTSVRTPVTTASLSPEAEDTAEASGSVQFQLWQIK